MESLKDLSEQQIAMLFHHFFNNPNPSNYQWGLIASEVGASLQQVYLFYRHQKNSERENAEEQKTNKPVQEEESIGSESYDDEEEEDDLPIISNLSDSQLSQLYDIFEENHAPPRRTTREIASMFGLDPDEVHAWFQRTRNEYGIRRERVLLKERGIDTKKKMSGSDPKEGEASKKQTPRRVLYSTGPMKRPRSPRTIGHLSEDELETLYNHGFSTPDPSRSDSIRIAKEMRLTVNEVKKFYEMQQSIGPDDVFESRDSREEVFGREVPPLLDHLATQELADLREIFKVNPNPTTDDLSGYAVDFRVDAGELKRWFHSERIDESHKRVMEQKQAKRKRLDAIEEEEESDPMDCQPPAKRAMRDAYQSETLSQFFQTSRNNSDREMFKLKEQKQEPIQKRQTEWQLIKIRQGDSSHTESVSAKNNTSEGASQNFQFNNDNAWSNYVQALGAGREQSKENEEIDMDDEKSKTVEDEGVDNMEIDD